MVIPNVPFVNVGASGQVFPATKPVTIEVATPIYEGSNADITLNFRDASGSLAVPTQIKYSIRDEATGRKLVNTTIVSSGLSADWTFTIPVTATRILVAKRKEYTEEIHTMTVEATLTGGDIVTGKVSFKVRRLRFYPF